ncbi:hypothetical protein PR048_021953 [Dryococelus australis]|uniref:Uncharacterized protein n=1 Tax=Dryococelus australis TaxID=614101 RepID=A0ABQ9GZN5_9NEOP|nr:hypothetical protein PR048_021953 [Dryococelus australis]
MALSSACSPLRTTLFRPWCHTRITAVAAYPIRAEVSRYDKPVSHRPNVLPLSPSSMTAVGLKEFNPRSFFTCLTIVVVGIASSDARFCSDFLGDRSTDVSITTHVSCHESAHEFGALSLWCNLPDLVKLILHEAEDYPVGRTLAGLQKRPKIPAMIGKNPAGNEFRKFPFASVTQVQTVPRMVSPPMWLTLPDRTQRHWLHLPSEERFGMLLERLADQHTGVTRGPGNVVDSWTGDRDEDHFEPPKLAIRDQQPLSANFYSSRSIYNEKYAYFHDVIYYESIAKFVSYLISTTHFGTKIDESEIHNHEISLMQHFYIGSKIKLDPGSELGSFDLLSGKMLVHPGISVSIATSKTTPATKIQAISFQQTPDNSCVLFAWRTRRKPLLNGKLKHPRRAALPGQTDNHIRLLAGVAAALHTRCGFPVDRPPPPPCKGFNYLAEPPPLCQVTLWERDGLLPGDGDSAVSPGFPVTPADLALACLPALGYRSRPSRAYLPAAPACPCCTSFSSRPQSLVHPRRVQAVAERPALRYQAKTRARAIIKVTRCEKKEQQLKSAPPASKRGRYLNNAPDYSSLTKTSRVRFPEGSPPPPPGIFACGNRAGRCRWSAGFLGDLPFPPPLHSGAAAYSPRFTLIGPQDLDVKSRPSLFASLQIGELSFVMACYKVSWIRRERLRPESARQRADTFGPSCMVAVNVADDKSLLVCYNEATEYQRSFVGRNEGNAADGGKTTGCKHIQSNRSSQYGQQLDELAAVTPSDADRSLRVSGAMLTAVCSTTAERRQAANTTVEMVPQMFNWIEIGAFWGPGKNLEVLIVLFQPRTGTSSSVIRRIIVLEDPILPRKDNHHVRVDGFITKTIKSAFHTVHGTWRLQREHSPDHNTVPTALCSSSNGCRVSVLRRFSPDTLTSIRSIQTKT